MYEVLSNAVSNLTGNITKAILFVRDRDAGGSTEDAEKDADTLRKSITSNVSSVLSLGSQTYASLLASGLTTANNYKALEVQYNPSSLVISTQGAGTSIDYSAGDSVRVSSTTQNFRQAVSVLQCQLIFDDTNIDDAFVQPTFSMNIGSAITAESALINTLAGGYSVQSQMDAIMGLLVSDVTRQVMFVWETMCFRGELVEVDNTYTMFNKSGNPIRGTMNISIRQEKMSSGDLDHWKSAFNDEFSGGLVGKSEMTLANAITNNSILNLSL